MPYSDAPFKPEQISRALIDKEFVSYYQPIVSVPDNRVIAVEALLRWQQPDSEPLLPGHFLPAVKKAHMMDEVDQYMLTQVLNDYSTIQSTVPGIALHLNITESNLRNPLWINDWFELVQTHQIDPALLVLEVPETIHWDIGLERWLEQIVKKGIRIALDDFGSGQTGLTTLTRFVFDIIKVDRSIIQRLDNERGRILIKNLAELSHGLKSILVAEGVETQQQWQLCEKFSLDAVQGYFHAPALPLHEALSYVRHLGYQRWPDGG